MHAEKQVGHIEQRYNRKYARRDARQYSGLRYEAKSRGKSDTDHAIRRHHHAYPRGHLVEDANGEIYARTTSVRVEHYVLFADSGRKYVQIREDERENVGGGQEQIVEAHCGLGELLTVYYENEHVNGIAEQAQVHENHEVVEGDCEINLV